MVTEITEDSLFGVLGGALGVEPDQPDYRMHVLKKACEALLLQNDTDDADDDIYDAIMRSEDDMDDDSVGYEPVEMLVPSKPPVNTSMLADDCHDGTAAVEWLIHPKQVDSFMENNEMKPLFISRVKYRSMYSGLFDSGGIVEALKRKRLRYGLDIDVTRVDDGVRKNFNYNKHEEYAEKHDVADAKVALRRFTHDKCSLRVLHPQRFTEPLWHLMYMLESYWGSCVGCNVYWTPKHSQGFAPHFDDIDAYILQIQGTKRWRLFNSVDTQTVLPRYSSRDFHKSELGAPVFDQVIEPGDLLYLPRGCIHEAECLDEDSLHLTISTNQRNSIFEFCNVLLPSEIEIQAMSNIRIRRTLPPGFVHHANSLAGDSTQGINIQTEISDIIQQITRQADIASGVDRWFMNFMLHRLPPPTQAKIPPESCSNSKLKKKSSVGLTYYDSAYPILDSREEQDTLFICHCLSNPREQHQTGEGREDEECSVPPQLELPVSCLETAVSLLNQEPINLSDVPETHDYSITKLQVAQALVDAGILTVYS
ncbi:Ribosomal oxygenase 1 [Picochlorum sp. SENEW3]|nr:Ribosomal oxygenase 1 [Picochlorum sp. SENEW3]